MRKTVLLIGASGLIGGELLNLLLKDDEIGTVKAFVRKPLKIKNDKLHEICVDFEKLEEFDSEFKGDSLFCCIGTTRKKTPNLDAYKAIDSGIVLSSAKMASNNKVPQIHLVSAIGADISSKIFYNQLKGEIEKDVFKFGFESTFIYQPALLIGKRFEMRPFEFLAQKIMPFFDLFLTKSTRKYHSIRAEKVAKSMHMNFCTPKKGVTILEYNEMINGILLQ